MTSSLRLPRIVLSTFAGLVVQFGLSLSSVMVPNGLPYASCASGSVSIALPFFTHRQAQGPRPGDVSPLGPPPQGSQTSASTLQDPDQATQSLPDPHSLHLKPDIHRQDGHQDLRKAAGALSDSPPLGSWTWHPPNIISKKWNNWTECTHLNF